MNKTETTEARRRRWLRLKTEKKMSLRAIGAAETPPVSYEYVRQIIGNTGRARVHDRLMEVHAFIKSYAAAHGFPPTNQEIAETFPNLDGTAPSSLSVVANWLRKLEEMGKLQITRKIVRGLKAL